MLAGHVSVPLGDADALKRIRAAAAGQATPSVAPTLPGSPYLHSDVAEKLAQVVQREVTRCPLPYGDSPASRVASQQRRILGDQAHRYRTNPYLANLLSLVTCLLSSTAINALAPSLSVPVRINTTGSEGICLEISLSCETPKVTRFLRALVRYAFLLQKKAIRAGCGICIELTPKAVVDLPGRGVSRITATVVLLFSVVYLPQGINSPLPESNALAERAFQPISTLSLMPALTSRVLFISTPSPPSGFSVHCPAVLPSVLEEDLFPEGHGKSAEQALKDILEHVLDPTSAAGFTHSFVAVAKTLSYRAYCN